MSKLPCFEGEAYGLRRRGCPTCRNTGPSNRVTRLTRGAFFLSERIDKALIRERAIRERLRLSPQIRAERSLVISEKLLQLDAVAAARTVAFYVAIGSEPDVATAAQACRERGKQVVFPRVPSSGRVLEFAPSQTSELVAGAHQTRQPPASSAAVPLAAIDCVVVPGVAFDARGVRLGRGGGFYDATLAAVPPSATRVGVAFESQIVASIPSEAHDVAMHIVVTDARVLFAAQAATAASH